MVFNFHTFILHFEDWPSFILILHDDQQIGYCFYLSKTTFLPFLALPNSTSLNISPHSSNATHIFRLFTL